MSLADEKYLSFTTYRRNGDPVSTPVWVVDVGDGEIGFGTSSQSGKAKRLANNPAVLVRPSDSRGRPTPGTDSLAGSARVVTGSEHAQVRDKVRAKYGVQVPLTKLIGTMVGIVKRRRQPYADVAVIVTLDDGSATGSR